MYVDIPIGLYILLLQVLYIIGSTDLCRQMVTAILDCIT